jgi:hypothetical protein
MEKKSLNARMGCYPHVLGISPVLLSGHSIIKIFHGALRSVKWILHDFSSGVYPVHPCPGFPNRQIPPLYATLFFRSGYREFCRVPDFFANVCVYCFRNLEILKAIF